MGNLFNIVTEEILLEMENGSAPWIKPWDSMGVQRNYVSSRSYKGFNVFLLAARGFDCPYWISTYQLKKLGGKLMKSAVPVSIFYWNLEKKKPKKQENQEYPEYIIRYRTFIVYNISQVTGLKEKKPKKQRLASLNNSCEHIMRNMPNPPPIKTNSDNAYYNVPNDEVCVPPITFYEDGAEYYCTIFHELIHSTGHESRLDRFSKRPKFESHDHQYSQEELVAELGAAFLCAHAGINNQGTVKNSAAYLRSWISVFKKDKTIFFYSSAQAQKAANYILNRPPKLRKTQK